MHFGTSGAPKSVFGFFGDADGVLIATISLGVEQLRDLYDAADGVIVIQRDTSLGLEAIILPASPAVSGR